MLQKPKITIMIPTYNQKEYILQAVESALNQDYKNLEIIVSDDSDNNETYEVLKDYIENNRIKYYHNIPRLGRVQNYFKTLNSYASGKWVLNLDGDDYLENHSFISKAIRLTENNNDVVMVFGRELKLNMLEDVLSERPTNRKISTILDGTDIFLNKRQYKINFYHLSTLYKREDAIQCEFYTNNCLGADTISLMKLMLGRKIAFLDEIGGVWRTHNHNESYFKDINLIMQNLKSSDILYNYAKSKNIIKTHLLDFWHQKSICIHFEIYFLHFLLSKEYRFSYEILKEFKQQQPKYFISLIKSPKFIIKLFFALLLPKVYKKYA